MVVLLALVIPALAVACVAPASGTARKGPSAKQRSLERSALLRAVRGDPRVAGQPWFLRKAALFGVDVPITVRLDPPSDQSGTPAGPSDDAVRIAVDDPPPDPNLPAGVTPGIVSSALTGGWAGSLRFSQDTAGYGGFGVVELRFRQVAMSGTGFDLIDAADPAPCLGGPALLATGPAIAINTGLRSQGFVDLFKETFDIALHTQFAFASQRRDDCAISSFGTTSMMTGESRPPLPIRLAGAFRISPAVTADGKVRLAKMTLRGVQSDSHVELRTCTDAAPAVPACPPDTKLTGRLLASSFTAEMLVGNVPL
ncbi:MAG: hypothetical protein ACJ77Z_00185 [Thermoleophilaceae bacterium]